MSFAQQPHSKCILTIHDDLGEEDFQTVSLDNDHWMAEEIPDRHLGIHKHSVPHSLCPYPCHTWIILLHHTMTHWSSVTFLNLMT